MQVSVETTGTLGRRITVQVPAERIDQEVDNRLKSLARTARISGFRPGKVPFKIVRQRYGQQVHLEVAGDVMSSSLHEALSQQNLRPAGQPKLEPRTVEQGKALEFIAEFEIYPEFEPAAVADVQIEKPVSSIGEQDVDAMLEKLRQQRASWETVDRAAARGDQVNVDFTGTIDGAEFAGGSGQGMTLEIGAGRLIEGFEAGLTGARAGDEVTLELRFPDDYHSAEVAGKPVQFKVKVNQVSGLRLPDVDDAFASALGVESGIGALREEIARNMRRELDQMIAAVVKERAFSQLLERNSIDVPATLVDEEIERLMRESQQQMGGAQGMNLPRSLFEKQAHRRVALGLIIGEIIKHNGIQVDPERVRRLIEGIAASYENPDEVVKWYYENREAMGSAQSLALEEQVVEWLLGQVQVVEKSCTFDELTEIRKTLST